LDLDGLNRSEKAKLKKEIGALYVEEIENSLDGSRSPVAGGRYKRTKKDGKLSKLLEKGDLRRALKSENRRGNDIEVGIFSKREAPKAFNHNTPESGGAPLPQRQAIPTEKQSFLKKIEKKVQSKINQAKQAIDAENMRENDSLLGDLLTTALTVEASRRTIDELLGISDEQD
jgi:hypothetical protein